MIQIFFKILFLTNLKNFGLPSKKKTNLQSILTVKISKKKGKVPHTEISR